MGDVELRYLSVFPDEARRGFGVNLIGAGDDGRDVLMHLDGSREPLEGVSWPSRVSALISDENAQDLMNRLWAQGLRPRGVDGGAGVVDAMRAHLASKDAHIEDIKHFASLAATNTMVMIPDAKGGA